ncbi:hypothetical protein BH09ACT4_BH09ACT4_24340 [soil metagenome]
MTEDKRDEVADAIRARQSLANDAQPGDEDLSAQGLSSGERFGGTDDPASDDEQALDDDDVELTGDDA